MENFGNVVKKFQEYPSNFPQNHPLLSHRFLITIIVIVFLVGVLPTIGTFVLLQSKFKKQEAFHQTNEVVQNIRKKIFSTLKLNIPTPTSTPTPVSSSKTYILDTVDVEFQLPSKFAEFGDLKEELVPADAGTKFCTTFVKKGEPDTKKPILSEIVSSTSCNPNTFAAAITSRGYTPTLPSEFLDLQGFSSSQGKYFGIIAPDKTISFQAHLIREVKNPNKVVLLRINGENDITNKAIDGTPGTGWIGALINLPNETYPALVLQMKLSDKLTEEDFDQILASIKFTE